MRAKVHVRQQVQHFALAQTRNDGFDTVHTPKQSASAEPLAALQNPGIGLLVGLIGVNGGEVPRQLLRQCRPTGIQPNKMGRKNDRRLLPRKLRHRPDELKTRAQHLLRAMPQPTAV